MTLPEIADELRDLAAIHGLPRLADLADEMKRRGGRKGPNTSARLTPAVISQIKFIHNTRPNLTQAEIGRLVNVNQGRVSEVLKGKRT